jgi:RND family efflux transporter MFP subunit
VAKPERRDVNEERVFVGRTEAAEFVEVRARVEGFLQTIEFEPGSDVTQGQLLFTIQPDEFQARVERARATVALNEAELARSQADLERVEQAVQTNAVSRSEVSMRQADRDKAAASLDAAKAELRAAELDLSYTKVYSPIAGRAGRQRVTIGNVVGAGERTLLTTVASLKPIWLYFEIPEQILTAYLRRYSAEMSDEATRKERFPVHAQVEGDEGFPHEGWIDFFSNTANPDTGTVQVRATFGNEGLKLYPGLFVRVRITGRPIENAVLVKETAIGTDLGGKFVLVVEPGEGLPDGQFMVANRRVQVGPEVDGWRVITDGLHGDEDYVVQGLARARPGLPARVERAPAGGGADAPSEDR